LYKEIEDKFTVDVRILNLLSAEERYCTYHELQTVYSLPDFYDMIEMMEVNTALREDGRRRSQKEQ
jgi:4-diphosphocytidyl-2C-methyl-D-erythritol kinase